MQTPTIDHKTLATLVRAGSVADITLVAHANTWAVVAKVGKELQTLIAQRGEVRSFRNQETATNYLRELGVTHYQVNAVDWQPGGPRTVREDARERLQHAHAAASYDKWFRAEVAAALEEVADPAVEPIPHEEVVADMATQRERLRRKLNG